ncbi:cytochrome P450 78A3 [Cajanus cajan]|uniref:Cytochrome P450 78A3 n=1 Tax=Cajanus cajan TaxID=3821 RepID=A0A151TY54_CAJCA|nr:cytochrome P450 78A3 [Cajanus cajan]KYP71976.1 Cytochrome P450 78A3 [Cajanus cajan]
MSSYIDDKLWIIGLANQNLAWGFAFFMAATLWLAITFFYWCHPGGPAWGKYYSYTTYPPIPGPKGWPLIGSMGLMGSQAHHHIAAAATACRGKRLMALSLGETRVIVTCHPDVAKEILNSSAFGDRPVKESAYSLMFNRAIGFASYGVYWRTLRRISANHLFCPRQIKASQLQRSQIATQMLHTLTSSRSRSRSRSHHHPLRVRQLLKKASLSNMMCSVFGQHYNDSLNQEEELASLVDQGYHLLGLFNWADHLPFLAHFDPQNIRFSCSNLVPKVNRFVTTIIAQHRATKTQTNRDFVDVLLSLPQPDQLSHSDMIAVLWEMIFRGTDTVAVLIEWILARMVLHPEVQSKVHEELDAVVGRSRAVAEDDVAAMTYLQAVVKEVLRLHPPGPLLSWARLSICDTTIDGYHVPAGTTAMVNMWAICRDPHVWVDPLEFMPHRFLTAAEFSILGSDLRLAPFGSGRRVCPGKTLGLATVYFWVASLLHHFQWLPSDDKGVDLTEVLRLSSEMANPLTVKLRPRP